MAGPALYCSVDDVLALVSLDAQARLATDPQIAVPLAVKGDGSALTFDTPFRYSTTITATVAGVPTAVTLSPGTGTDGVDQIIFGAPPALGALIMAKADLNAVNVSVILQCIRLATNKVKGSLARYGTENLPADVLAVVNTPTVFYSRWFLRIRRNMSEYDPIIEEYKSNERWLLSLAQGKIAFPASAPIATAAPPSPSATIAEPSVFDAPGSTSNDIFGF